MYGVRAVQLGLAGVSLALLAPLLATGTSPHQAVPASKVRSVMETSAPKVAPGSTVKLKGWSPQPNARVQLQKQTKHGWRRVKFMRTGKDGNFSSRVKVSRATTFRAYPEKAGLSSRPLRVKVRRQSASLQPMPGLSQPGTSTNLPVSSSQILATFKPALPGQIVQLERLQSNGWVPAGQKQQSVAGAVAFDVTAQEPYRVRSGSYTSKSVASKAYPLLFSEDFDVLDTTVWLDQPRPGAGSRTCGVSGPAARSVSDGLLRLRVINDAARETQTCFYEHEGQTKTSPYLLSSQIATARAFSFTHGYAAARVKMHGQAGAHFGFWLLPYKPVMDPERPWHDVGFVPGDPTGGAEIDIVEYWANEKKHREAAIGSFLHWYNLAGTLDSYGKIYPRASRHKAVGERWDDAYHVFSVRWTPTYYEFMVDGHVYGRIDKFVSQAPQYPVLSLVSSDYEISSRTGESSKDEALVDWVRVWGLQ